MLFPERLHSARCRQTCARVPARRSTRRQPRGVRREPAPLHGEKYPCPLERPPLCLASNEVTRAHRKRHDRPRRILVGLRHERTAISDEKVLHVMGAAICVDYSLRRVATHASSAELMDDLTAARDAVSLLPIWHRAEDLSAHLFYQ